jgi:hypothetical protein
VFRICVNDDRQAMLVDTAMYTNQFSALSVGCGTRGTTTTRTTSTDERYECLRATTLATSTYQYNKLAELNDVTGHCVGFVILIRCFKSDLGFF